MSHVRKTFKVVTISSNTNSFGLHGIVLMARDGEAYEVARYQGVTPWHNGQEISVPRYKKGDCQMDSKSAFPVPCSCTDAALNWAAVGVEIPRKLPKAPRKVIVEVWGKCTR